MELVSTYCTMCDYAKTQSKGYVMSSWYALRACPKNLETSLALEILNWTMLIGIIKLSFAALAKRAPNRRCSSSTAVSRYGRKTLVKKKWAVSSEDVDRRLLVWHGIPFSAAVLQASAKISANAVFFLSARMLSRSLASSWMRSQTVTKLLGSFWRFVDKVSIAAATNFMINILTTNSNYFALRLKKSALSDVSGSLTCSSVSSAWRIAGKSFHKSNNSIVPLNPTCRAQAYKCCFTVAGKKHQDCIFQCCSTFLTSFVNGNDVLNCTHWPSYRW